MHPILFKIGSLNFYSHGVLIVAGIVFSALLVHLLSKKSELDRTFLFDNMIYLSLFGLIGARVAYFIIYPHQYDSISQIFLLWQGGLVSFGGFIVGAIVLLFLLRLQKQPILPWFDLFAIGLPLGIAFGRFGDWLAGDYGTLPIEMANRFSGMFFNNPLLESILCLVIFVLTLLIYLFWNGRRDGIILYLSILIYSLGRFIIGFWRGDPNFFVNLSLGQIFSLLVFITTAISFIITTKRRKGVYDGAI